jgi:hypothetical protein
MLARHAPELVAGISRNTQGKTITLSSSSARHPFAPKFDGKNNSYAGITKLVIRSPSGTPATIAVESNVGGKPGAWTITATQDVPAVAADSTAYDWANYELRIPRLAALAAQNVMVAITEFGPGKDVGPSPTLVTPGEVISTAEANGLGWMAWAWDNNDLDGGRSSDRGFSMTNSGPGIYVDSSNLTSYGRDVVLNPTYGLSVLAKRASVFP